MVLTEKAYAKVNLYLDVVGKRPDGFHDIETLMHTVTLSDDLVFEVTDSASFSVELKIEGNDTLMADDSNLVIRAVKEFTDLSPIRAKLSILLRKNIPTEAGLGGGSADAAATLRALNRITKAPLSEEEMYKLAEKLGSDVPFCLNGGYALCRGRGEQITPLQAIQNLHLVIVNSGESVSTPEAFKMLDQSYDDFYSPALKKGKNDFITSISKGEVDSLYNIFEDVILPQCKRANMAKKELMTLGAKNVLMSGSGPTVFGVFDSAESAEIAFEKIKNKFDTVIISQFK